MECWRRLILIDLILKEEILMKKLFLIITIFFATSLFSSSSYSQIIAPSGTASEASQLIFYYDNADSSSFIQVGNDDNTESVWIHVQVFRSFDPSDDPPAAPVLCEERNFVDFLSFRFFG